MRLYLNDKEADYLMELLSYGVKLQIKADNPDIDINLMKRIERCQELQNPHRPT